MQRPEFLSSEQKKRFHFFNSFFYKKLSETANTQVEGNLNLMCNLNRLQDIFGQYVLIPVTYIRFRAL